MPSLGAWTSAAALSGHGGVVPRGRLGGVSPAVTPRSQGYSGALVTSLTVPCKCLTIYCDP